MCDAVAPTGVWRAAAADLGYSRNVETGACLRQFAPPGNSSRASAHNTFCAAINAYWSRDEPPGRALNPIRTALTSIVMRSPDLDTSLVHLRLFCCQQYPAVCKSTVPDRPASMGPEAHANRAMGAGPIAALSLSPSAQTRVPLTAAILPYRGAAKPDLTQRANHLGADSLLPDAPNPISVLAFPAVRMMDQRSGRSVISET